MKLLTTLTTIILSVSVALAQGTPPKQPPLERLGASLAKLGVKRCAPILRHVASFLIEGGDAAFSLKSLGTVADTAPAMLSIESAHAALGTTRYATVIVVPSESCSGYYEQSIYWAAPCASVKQSNFANFPASKPLLKNIQASAASATVSLYLVPAGAGCMSIKKEIFH